MRKTVMIFKSQPIRACKMLILLFVLFPICAKSQITTDLKAVVIIDIIVRDTSMLNDGFIEFKMSKDNVNSDYTSRSDYYSFRINSKKTRLVLPLSTQLNYGRVNFYYKNQDSNRTNQAFNNNNNLFVFQSGDSIQISLDKNNVSFAGKGSEKFITMRGINEHQEVLKSHREKEETYFKASNYDDYLLSCIQHSDSLYQIKRNLLVKSESRLNREVYDLMSADIFGEYAQDISAKILLGGYGGDAKYNEVAKRYYDNFVGNLNKEALSDSVLAKSFKYCDILFMMEMLAERLFSVKPKNLGLNSRFVNMYNSIQKNYTGKVKDKVTLIALIFGKGDPHSSKIDLNPFYRDAISKAIDSPYKKEIISLSNSSEGPAFPFELPDKNGKIHRLSDFKGKLIVVDFWFTGCGACVGMAKSLKPIITDYKSNPKIVFISISTDGNSFKEVWLKSLEREIYSSKEEINLLAVDGGNSEIIKHYNIIGYPTLLIISKEGKIISINPPNPRENVSDFRNFIDQHL